MTINASTQVLMAAEVPYGRSAGSTTTTILTNRDRTRFYCGGTDEGPCDKGEDGQPYSHEKYAGVFAHRNSHYPHKRRKIRPTSLDDLALRAEEMLVEIHELQAKAGSGGPTVIMPKNDKWKDRALKAERELRSIRKGFARIGFTAPVEDHATTE